MNNLSIAKVGPQFGYETAGSVAMNPAETAGSVAFVGAETAGSVAAAPSTGASSGGSSGGGSFNAVA
ncbi:MAG: hypothetical protein PHV37_04225 [Candidatus Gastranaerophilales bacterium]|nr:hypothetical protein [Candidatus Gastranaerophilales bacterium]